MHRIILNLSFLLAFILPRLAKADCHGHAAEAQFISEYKVKSINPKSCTLILANPTLFNPSGVCPLYWGDIEGVEIKIDRPSCDYLKEHRTISGVVSEKEGHLSLEF